MLWELPKSRIGLSERQPDYSQAVDYAQNRQPKLLPWMIFSTVLLALLGVNLIGQIMLLIIAPYARPLGIDLFAVKEANYAAWDGESDNPGLAARTNTDPVEAADADENALPLPPEVVRPVQIGRKTTFLPIIIYRERSSPLASIPTPTATQRPPTATPTSARVGLEDQSPTAIRIATATPAVQPSPTSRAPTAQPSATATALSSAPTATPTTGRGSVASPTTAPATSEPTARPTRTPRATGTADARTRTPTPKTTNPPVIQPSNTPRPSATASSTPAVSSTPTATSTPAASSTPTTTSTPTATSTPQPVSVRFSAASYAVGEGDSTASITVRLSAPSSRRVSVQYRTSDETATADEDYSAANGTLSFPPGSTEQTFKIEISDDPFVEDNETLALALAAPSAGALLGTPARATLTIVDDDERPTLAFSSATYTIDEDGGAARITVRISAPLQQAATVTYAASDGSATAESDYTAVAGTLTFPAGSSEQSFAVPISNDLIDETDETVILALDKASSNVQPGTPARATLTIGDDDDPPLVAFSSADYTVSEQDETAAITVRLSVASAKTITVQYRTSDGSATEDQDYTAASGTLTFAPGVVEQSFTVVILDDTLDENNETVALALAEPTNASAGALNSATLTIVDNDGAPTVQFSSAAYTVNEDDGSATITVRLSAPSARTASVQYRTSDGTATEDEDYSATSGTLTFAPGVTSQSFTVAVADDTLYEPDETINLALSNPANATLNTPSSALLTIVSDDSPPTYAFSAATYSATEGDTAGFSSAATVRVTRSGDTSGSGSVRIQFTDAGATGGSTPAAGVDYNNTALTVNFAAGETARDVNIPIAGDTIFEGNEDALLRLTTPSPPGIIGLTRATAVLTVIDDDSRPTITLSSATYTVEEDGGSAAITVRLSNPSAQVVTVRYATSGGTATAGSDYTAASGILTFNPAGALQQTFSVPIRDDTLDENNETVGLVLSSPSNATLGTPAQATLTIVDDESPPVIRFRDAPYSVSESLSEATITVELSAPSGRTVTVEYETLTGTATEGVDYTATSGVLTFAPGVTEQSFAITILDDLLVELNQTVPLRLSNPSNATLGTPSDTTLTIINNDVVVRILNPTVECVAYLGGGNYRAYFGYDNPNEVQVGVVLGSDNMFTPGSINRGQPTLFDPGRTSFPPAVFAVDFDGNPLTWRLAGHPATASRDPAQRCKPAVGLTATKYTVEETGGSVAITVALDEPASVPVTVGYATSGGSATAGVDYSPVNGTLTFVPGGPLQQTISIPILADADSTAYESMMLLLNDPVNASLGIANSALLEIVESPLVPDDMTQGYNQTNGPNAAMGEGDWYTSVVPGKVAGYHYFAIHVPAGWPAAESIHIDLFSPEMVSEPSIDETTGSADTTTFELYRQGTLVGPAINQPAPGGGNSLVVRNYPPTAGPDQWRRFSTITPPAGGGRYILRVETSDDDQNGWGIRVGYDDDGDPTNPPPAHFQDFDGLPGTNDEIVVGTFQAASEQAVSGGGINCQSRYVYIGPTASSVVFRNFDIEGMGSVSYYSPAGNLLPGTVSAENQWNNDGTTSPTSRLGGDVIPIEPGWWQIRTCTDNNNQYIQEAAANGSLLPLYAEQPPTPAMQVSVDDRATSVSLAGSPVLTYTIAFANVSDRLPAPGTATTLRIVSQLDPGVTNVTCSIRAPLSGLCVYDSVSRRVTFLLDQSFYPGGGGTVQMSARITAPGTFNNTVTLDYRDSLGNRYLPTTGTDSTTVTP